MRMMIFSREGVSFMAMEKIESLQSYRRFALECARDLCYSEEVIKKINEATSVTQISNIMQTMASSEAVA